MKQSLTILISYWVFASACWASAVQAKNPSEILHYEATQAGVLKMAMAYATASEANLKQGDKAAIAQIRKTLSANKFSDEFFKKAIDTVVNQLSLKLANGKSLDALLVASNILLNEAPKSRRVLNLFGSVLNVAGKDRDAVAVFEYALSLDPQNLLTRLNLANCYLDANSDEKAKAILDKLEYEDSGNKAVYRALATYYYRKNNAAMFRKYLLKAASFKGYKRKKTDKAQQQVEANEVQETDSLEQMEAKLDKVKDVAPLTTADLLEEEYPDAAKKIRDKYGKLAKNEKWILPRLPMTNLNGPPDYQRNKPVIEEWANAANARLSIFPKRQAEAMGIDPDASDDVQERQVDAAADKQIAEALRLAQDAIKYMQNVPGVSQAEIAKVKREMQEAMKEQGIEAEDKPADGSTPPGADSGSVFALVNYFNFMRIHKSYNSYFTEYYREIDAKFADIMKVYADKIEEENSSFEPVWDRLQAEHQASSSDNGPHGTTDEACRRAQLEHKKRLNAISDNYYRQWSNLYMPQYAQKMKPTLDAYFNVCMLHIRNMNDPKVMERSYITATGTYMMRAMLSIGYMGMGDRFEYHPETEAEEQELDRDVALAKEEAERKAPEFKRDFQSPDFSFTDWVNDHFVLEISGEFLALKVSAKAIEFEAYVPGIGAGAKYDFSEQKFETYTGAGLKLDIGVNICGLGAKAEGKGDFYRRTATWEFSSGKYSETDSAKAEVKGSFGPLSAGGEFELDTQLNAKAAGKISFMDTLTLQGQQDLN